MKYIKRSEGNLGKWAPASGRREYPSWSWCEFSVVLGTMKLVNVCDKVMTYITLFCSDRGYYPHFVDIVDLSAFCGYYLYWSHYKLLSS